MSVSRPFKLRKVNKIITVLRDKTNRNNDNVRRTKIYDTDEWKLTRDYFDGSRGMR